MYTAVFHSYEVQRQLNKLWLRNAHARGKAIKKNRGIIATKAKILNLCGRRQGVHSKGLCGSSSAVYFKIMVELTSGF